MPSSNPRYANTQKRTQIRKWLLATQDYCALCGKPIDKTLKTPHPMSAEVDEIIPISKGGSPIARDNVQLVHRRCNQRKSSKIVGREPQKIIELPLPTSRDW
ncbi:MAG: HNH endonuclease [Clostridiales Family XIII bacterium]|nr:HNH endonuclease [Clostridiales Family XIII bacterium]